MFFTGNLETWCMGMKLYSYTITKCVFEFFDDMIKNVHLEEMIIFSNAIAFLIHVK